ncbi:MAG: acetyl-CoA hydrolase [Betaproteobacteria bacterium RIFCSPLOWO2_02_FULL_63_19]|nr:MAG: acetyl-CoA hydrolase [Betaproteobacteria bacterium RIFCSPLOWO2_02_FULL_63_19]
MVQELDLRSLDFAGIIRPGDTVMWGQATAEPVPLTQALMAQRHSIGRFSVFLGMTHSDTPRPEHTDCIAFSSYCGTGGNRALVKAGKLDILPCHYSQLPELIRSERLKIDVLMLQLAPADRDGHYSFGIAHEFLIAAMDAARVVIAEVNEQAPWTYGERPVREADLDYIVRTSRAPLEIVQPVPGDTERAIARHVAAMIEDGATLQFGLGAMPEAILGALADRRDLGIHSGTIGDTVADLTRSGVITNARKSIDPGVTVTGMMMGSKRLHDFTHRNPGVQFRSTAYVHNADVLARIERFVVLNTAIEVDLTGQINAEVAGGMYIGTVGGALDFLRAANRSRGGLPVVALPSTAGRGHKRSSRIVTGLSGPVSTPRSDAGIIATEHGIADLRGMPFSERRRRMIAIAHPDFREHLERESARPGVPGIGS